jgi:imidazolonepropionase-like amidohydrolase
MPAAGVRSAVREYIASSGIDFLKYASTAHGQKKFIAFSPDSQRAIVEEAHAAGLEAQACTMTPEALRMAIDAGVDLLQHGNHTGLHPMPRETVELIVERQLPCACLLYTERYRRESAGAVKNGEFTREDERMEIAMQNAAELARAGAKLVASTDGGVFGPTATTSPFWQAILANYSERPYVLGSANRLWLQAAVECGMRPMDALVASTRNVAEAYGRLDDLGTLERGKFADFVVLAADPFTDVRSYGDIVHVVKEGTLVDREALPTNPVLTGGPRARTRLVS